MMNAQQQQAIADYVNAPMSEGDFEVLARLLARYNNQIVRGTEQDASIYGRKMDSALCRDTLATLARHMDYHKFNAVQSEAVKAS